MSDWNTSGRKAELPPNWPALRRRILARDRNVCRIRGSTCTGRATHVDHIRRGGDHRDENLHAVCAECHGRKSSAEGHEAQRRRRALRLRPVERHPGADE